MGSSHSKLGPEVAINRNHPLLTHAVDIDLSSYVNGDYMLTCSLTGQQFRVRVPQSVAGILIFLNGPQKTDQVLLVMNNVSSFATGQFAIKLPASLDEYRGPLSHFLYTQFGFHLQYYFDLDVGKGPNRTVERFEWRKSNGPEVQALNVRNYSWFTKGWKLVRVPKQRLNKGDQQYMGYASDGGEIVAVMGHKSGIKSIGRFALTGSAKLGELGDVFKLMALATYMTLHWHEAEKKRRSLQASRNNMMNH